MCRGALRATSSRRRCVTAEGVFGAAALQRGGGDADNRWMHPTSLSGTAVNGQVRHLLGIVIDIGICVS